MEFPQISKANWKSLIEKELGDKKSLHELLYVVGDELEVDILLQEEDRIANDNLDSFPKTTSFGIYSTGNIDNMAVLTSLKYGGSGLFFHDPAQLENKNVLENVLLDAIRIYTFYQSPLSQDSSPSKNLDYSYYEADREAVIDVRQAIENKELLRSMTKAINSRGEYVGIIVDESFLLTIALLRAIRILMQRRGEYRQVLTFSGHSEKPQEFNLIRYTTHTQAVMAGGSDRHFYPCRANTSMQEITRMMHIANILHYESHANGLKDPWKGSYVIEHLTSALLLGVEKRQSRE